MQSWCDIVSNADITQFTGNQFQLKMVFREDDFQRGYLFRTYTCFPSHGWIPKGLKGTKLTNLFEDIKYV